ncbi:hypothetical protein [Litorihabitans aurantiacus]|uniref:Uncharacterized protein n=1 Tax=Litorihabitans aurantiacus TaxID=1930061 RepID=A0AA37XFG1_9MICO|nr:hypothetical protein [Litorihabitans aurantiacus]GMA32179.1 hypothetical protein GCM10025875_21710 [Litorihabitans aurantiacus]
MRFPGRRDRSGRAGEQPVGDGPGEQDGRGAQEAGLAPDAAGTDPGAPTGEIDLSEVGRPEPEPAHRRRAAAGTRTPLNRTVWVIAAVAVVALGAGMVLQRFVVSPAQAAADTAPPEPGLVTVPVERRALSSDVVARGDARYDDAVEVTIETSDLGGPAVVTGAVPDVGAQVDAGSVVLEIAGRPVVALPGAFPVYRTIRAGATGPDVLQLRDALNSLGLEAGDGETYDGAMAGAVERLYARAGYPVPDPPEGAAEALESAELQVRSATAGLETARAAVTTAGAGAPRSERIGLDNAVAEAERQLEDARACAAAPAPTDPETGAALPRETCALSVGAAEGAVTLARAQRDEGLAAPDTSAEVAARDAAQRELTDAEEALGQARQDVLTPMPASEVVYVSSFPRRVDGVTAQRGTTVTGAAMTISGATLEIAANLARADADLLAVDQAAELLLDDTPIAATVVEIGAQAPAPSSGSEGSSEGSAGSEGGGGGSGGADPDRVQVVLVPGELSDPQRDALAGSNVRIRIPVSSTSGEVLAVPIAALTAGPGGESRVEVLRDGADEPELVVVTTGLTASGMVEVVTSEQPLEAGDRVVVGAG